jgi:crotonobetainyl-CoA:carnitine CoA-transferase CaiB-like acyl-CoA transferase
MLSGVRVVSFTQFLLGPSGVQFLADLGADVVKVEPPEGDVTRGWGPPWVGDEAAGTRTAAYYLAVNRNKRSIRLDLRTPDGAAILRQLLSSADLFVENFRSGGLERLGFGEAELSGLNERLVHVAITGYGSTGLDALRPGYDFVIQAESGLMSITGAPDADGGRPMKVGVAIADVVAGLQGAVAALAGLVGREREGSGGRGQRIEVSLLASALAVLVNQAQNAFVGDKAPGRLGNAHPNIVPYETFVTADGEIAVAVGSERQWPRFCRALGLPALADDPRFATNADRVANRVELIATLAARLAERSSDDWLTALDVAEVPAGRINDIREAFAAAAATAQPMTTDLDHPVLGRTTQVLPPFMFSRTPASVRTPPPLLGEQTDAVLAELGYDADAITALRAAGVV